MIVTAAFLVGFMLAWHLVHHLHNKERRVLSEALRRAQIRMVHARELIFFDWFKAAELLGIGERDAARALRDQREDIVAEIPPQTVDQVQAAHALARLSWGRGLV